MLEEILSEELGKVDRKASEEKEGIRYVVKLVEENYAKLAEISGLTNEKKLFEFAKQTLWDVENLCRPIGVITVHTDKPEEYKSSIILLGWAKLQKTNSSSMYFLCSTNEGTEIVNGYRKAMGRYTVEQEREMQREIANRTWGKRLSEVS